MHRGKGPVSIYRLGGGGRAEDFREDHLIFRRTKVASVVTENPKGGSLKTLDGLRGGTTKFVWKMKTWGEGIAKVIKCY